jgi:hypothetical protein
MARYFRQSVESLWGAEHFMQLGHRGGSTDMGDLSQVIPCLHPYLGGAAGTGHAADYRIADPDLAYVGQAKALASMVVDMLADGAAGAREVLGKAKRPLTRAGYLELQRTMARREVYEGR